MKIEMGESLFYSWLRHVKDCQIVQNNWKPSPQWNLLHADELEALWQSFSVDIERTFGYKKSSANNMLRIGKTFTNPEHNGSTLPHTTAKDFTVSQISEMLTVKPTALIEACEKERITPNMTQKEIREVVKELNGKKTVEGEAKELATEKVEKKKAEPEKALEGLTDDGIKAYREFRRQIDKAMGEKWYNMVTLTFIKEDGTKEEKTLKVEDWYGKSIETEIIEKMEKAGI